MIKVDEDRCIGCGACINECPFGAISMVGSKAKINDDLCRGCMICARCCGEGAIVTERIGEKTEEVKIKRKPEEIVEELETGKISCERVEELEGVVTLLKNECISGAQKYPGEEYRYSSGTGCFGGGAGFGRRYRRR